MVAEGFQILCVSCPGLEVLLEALIIISNFHLLGAASQREIQPHAASSERNNIPIWSATTPVTRAPSQNGTFE
jgi:hypothetical protein